MPEPLPKSIVSKLAAVGVDVSAVRIYVGQSKSEAVGALAYVKGSDIHFAPGQYNPNSKAGQQLLGHELAHLVATKMGKQGTGTASDVEQMANKAATGSLNQLNSCEKVSRETGLPLFQVKAIRTACGIENE